MTDRDIDVLLQREIERQLPLFETDTDQQTLRAALHGLRGSISMAGYGEISLVLGQLGRRLLEGDAHARREAGRLLRDTAARIDQRLPVLETRWPTPPPGLAPSRVEAAIELEYSEAMRSRLGEIDAALSTQASAESALAQAFRSVHAMKSAASSVGDDAFAWYCHGLESLLKPALDSESAAREALVALARHRVLCAVWLEDPGRALDTLREFAKRPSNQPPESSTPNAQERPPDERARSSTRLSPYHPNQQDSAPATTSSAELFERVSRALSYVLANSNRLASISTRGNQVGIDPATLEALELALLQLVRNSVAHGIEPPAERERAGKNPTGQITLHAERHGDLLNIHVEDDGAGVDLGALRELLLTRGMLADPGAATGSDELLPFLFTPGLSTRSEADLLGGRGMGLDIARQAVADIGGTLRLSSLPDAGLRATIELLAPGAELRGTATVCKAAERHVDAVRQLATLAGLHVDPAGELARGDAYLLVAESVDAKLAGFASARVCGDVVELLDLATHPVWRRRGVAGGLLQELAAAARRDQHREIYLEVRESNLGAIALYDKLGFERIRQRERYYKNPVEDALCMRLVL